MTTTHNVSGEGPAGRPAPAGHAMLFCPADRPDRFRKALEAADAVIIDLEDAVSPDGKDRARDTVSDALSWLPPDRTVVRINSPRTDTGVADLEMLRHSPARFVMVPKVEAEEEIEMAAPLTVIALCETARGIQRVPVLANADGCVAVMWGGEDLTADIGGSRSRGTDGAYLPHVQYARSRTLIAAAAAGIAAWDGVYLDIADLAGLENETRDAVCMGFDAKVIIHPSHAAVVRRTYRPADDQIRWAGKLLDAVRAAGSGVTTFDGRMVDGPLIQMAENILHAARVPQ
ncbi:MAG: CoA ester lyase [Mycobacterium sp.]